MSSREPDHHAEDTDRTGWLSVPDMLYPNEYVWLIFVASLDIMLTWVILGRGGKEMNPIAHLVIESWDLGGAIAFKFSLMLFVILTCEFVGRVKPGRARWLARLAVAISAVPPAWSLTLLMGRAWG